MEVNGAADTCESDQKSQDEGGRKVKKEEVGLKKKRPKIGPASRVRRDPSSGDEELTRNAQGTRDQTSSKGSPAAGGQHIGKDTFFKIRIRIIRPTKHITKYEEKDADLSDEDDENNQKIVEEARKACEEVRHFLQNLDSLLLQPTAEYCYKPRNG